MCASRAHMHTLPCPHAPEPTLSLFHHHNRYTMWVFFNASAATPNFSAVVADELYVHEESPLPVDFAVEHNNVVTSAALAPVVKQLRNVIVTCAQRPDQCPPELLHGLV